MNSGKERLINGIIKENPTFVLMLGMCPTLAVTTSAMNGLGMGLTTTVVLALSNVFISLLRNIIPDKVRIPAFIVIIASFVTMLELLLEGFLPSLYAALGIYIPLIVVNCIILGRAEAYASKNPVFSSFFDGLGMGLGFSIALTCIGAVRELLGAGDLFGFHMMPTAEHPWLFGGKEIACFTPASIFVLAPGAFFVLACLTAIQNKVKLEGEKKGKDMSKIGSGCSEDCMNCGEEGCGRRKFYDTEAGEGPVGQKEEKQKEAGQQKKEEKQKEAGQQKKEEKQKEAGQQKNVKETKKEQQKTEEQKTKQKNIEKQKKPEQKDAKKGNSMGKKEREEKNNE